MLLANMTRSDMEVEVLDNDSLYAKFDEARLMSSKYTDEEMRDIIQKWIEEGDETYQM